jgi:hypothetical protein
MHGGQRAGGEACAWAAAGGGPAKTEAASLAVRLPPQVRTLGISHSTIQICNPAAQASGASPAAQGSAAGPSSSAVAL